MTLGNMPRERPSYTRGVVPRSDAVDILFWTRETMPSVQQLLAKPTDNAFIESFNARVRLECLNQHWFLDLDDACTKIDHWRRDYNDVRPHSAIGEGTPMIMFTAHRNTTMGSTAPEVII